MNYTTQDNILIEDIKQDIILLKGGGAALVLRTTAVNFGLLSGEEQLAIIQSFGQTLNSLSFPIQIVIRSKRLDISEYLQMLDKAIRLQGNSLLAGMMVRYKQFIKSSIKENEVLDKSFYIIIPLYSFEEGILSKKEERLKKIQTTLGPKREQLVRQLARVGIKAQQLTTNELIKLFFNIYNPPKNQEGIISIAPTNLNLEPQTKQQLVLDQQDQKPPSGETINQPISTQKSRTHPFIVEELSDTI